MTTTVRRSATQNGVNLFDHSCNGCTGSEAFDITGVNVPEPSSASILSVELLIVCAVLRYKTHHH